MSDASNDALNTPAETSGQVAATSAEHNQAEHNQAEHNQAEHNQAEHDQTPTPEPSGDAFAHVEPLLELRRVTTHYGPIRVLHNVDMVIYPGEMVCLLGGNASGKSTTLKTILGVVRVTEGEMYFRGQRADNLTIAERIQHGMAVVPENRRIFPKMTVRENLEMGAYLRNDRAAIREDMEYVFTLFPRLSERIEQLGGTMSGGEQQMLAMGRALMSRPKLILMDEPSMGLAPLFVERIFEIIKQVNERGISVFVVEQNANVALSIADRGYVLQTGEVVLSGPAQDLLHNEAMKRAYLGEV